MKQNTIDLFLSIYTFVEAHPNLPMGRTEATREYTRIRNAFVNDIPETSGLYFWNSSSGKPIYIGMAVKTRKGNSLRYRIRKELKDEAICFWSGDAVNKKKGI